MFIYHIIVVKEYNKQIRELSKLIRAKDLTEYSINENMKEKKDVMSDEIVPDFVPAESVESELFQRMIDRQTGKEE